MIIAEHSGFKIFLDEGIVERENGHLYLKEESFQRISKIEPTKFGYRSVFTVRKGEKYHHLQADYYIGTDWLIEGVHSFQVEPKLNKAITEYFNRVAEEEEESPSKEIVPEELDEKQLKRSDTVEVDYLRMLLDVMSTEKTAKETAKIIQINWDARRIPIQHDQDKLTPFLIVQFLQLTKAIVKKGLKKSYYKVRKNLRNRVKGKILVSAQIKSNVVKNRFGYTLCEYQEFGFDSRENRFLKKVFKFCLGYVENHGDGVFKNNFSEIQNLLNYCRPAFEHIGDFDEPVRDFSVKHNPFFNEYKEAVQIGNFILKRFGFNYSKIGKQKTETPPFWIDMPILFELYFYHLLSKANPKNDKNILYQFGTYGNSLDFLIKDPPMIIDTKYKPVYNKGRIHDDIRQVSGYARLKKVRRGLGIYDADKMIDCVIVYPILEKVNREFNLSSISNYLEPIKMYEGVYKFGINLPLRK